MRGTRFGVGLSVALGLAGCDVSLPPRLAIPKEGAATTEAAKPPVYREEASARPPTKPLYKGRTVEQWGQMLSERNVDKVYRASRALHVLGPEGRPYLVEGLQSPNPETRRLALEALSVSDFRAYGDDGRRLLVQLAGDRADLRIRERATIYLSQWNRALPSP